MLIYSNYVFHVSSVTHNLNLKMWKGNECTAKTDWQNVDHAFSSPF